MPITGVVGNALDKSTRLASVPMRFVDSPKLARTLVRLMAAQRVEDLVHQERLDHESDLKARHGIKQAKLFLVKYMEFTANTPTLDNHCRSIILFGRNVASYKFALSKALL